MSADCSTRPCVTSNVVIPFDTRYCNADPTKFQDPYHALVMDLTRSASENHDQNWYLRIPI